MEKVWVLIIEGEFKGAFSTKRKCMASAEKILLHDPYYFSYYAHDAKKDQKIIDYFQDEISIYEAEIQ